MYIYCMYPKENNIKAKIDKRLIVSVHGHVRYNISVSVFELFLDQRKLFRQQLI